MRGLFTDPNWAKSMQLRKESEAYDARVAAEKKRGRKSSTAEKRLADWTNELAKHPFAEGPRTDLKNEISRLFNLNQLPEFSEAALMAMCERLGIDYVAASPIEPGQNAGRPVTHRGLRQDLALRVQGAKQRFKHTSDAYQLELSLAEVALEATLGLKATEASVAQFREARALVKDSVEMVCAPHRLSCKTCRDADEFSEGDFIAALKEFAATE